MPMETREPLSLAELERRLHLRLAPLPQLPPFSQLTILIQVTTGMEILTTLCLRHGKLYLLANDAGGDECLEKYIDMKSTKSSYPIWRSIFLLFVLAISASETMVAKETTGSVLFTIAKKIVVLEVTKKSVSLTETISCLTIGPADNDTSDKYTGFVFSGPLVVVVQDKEMPFFDTLPSISVTGGGTAELKQDLDDPLKPGGAYVINMTFLKGSIPRRFDVILTCHKEIGEESSMEFVYRWTKHNPRPVVVGHPHDWGPYELRVNCDKLHEISLKKGSGWVETYDGKASIDLESSDGIELGIAPRSKDDPVAQVGRIENGEPAGKQ